MSKYKFETLQVHVGQETPDSATDSRAVPEDVRRHDPQGRSGVGLCVGRPFCARPYDGNAAEQSRLSPRGHGRYAQLFLRPT